MSKREPLRYEHKSWALKLTARLVGRPWSSGIDVLDREILRTRKEAQYWAREISDSETRATPVRVRVTVEEVVE